MDDGTNRRKDSEGIGVGGLGNESEDEEEI